MQVDLLANFPKVVDLEVVNDETKTSRVERIKIQYDIIPTYCKLCKLKMHVEKNVGFYINNSRITSRKKGMKIMNGLLAMHNKR